MKCFALVLLLLCGTAMADDADWSSNNGLFVVRYQADIDPLAINTLHGWTLHLEDLAGAVVLGARIEASGGMPVHNHGLPTAPRITTELGNGDYRLEGLRFHMTGPWEITLNITAGGVSDTVVIALEL